MKISSRIFREIEHAEHLTACLQKLINVGWQKEFHAVVDHTLHSVLVRLITATAEELLASGSSIYALSFVLEAHTSSISCKDILHVTFLTIFERQ